METLTEDSARSTAINANDITSSISGKFDTLANLGILYPEIKQKKGLLIFHITTTDPAGAAFNLVQATNAYTEHRARLLTMAPNVYGHPSDISAIPDYGDEVESLLVDADIIHFHKIDESVDIEFPSSKTRTWRISDFLTVNGKKKKIVYHIHGHPYERANPEENGKKYGAKNGIVLASTPDLEEMYSPYCDVRYFPNCVPIWDAKYLPRQTNKILEDRKGLKGYTVSHTVSNPILKDANMIEEAVAYVKRTQPISLTTIQRASFEMAMVMKRPSHIVFDHMQGYYGLSSLEGFAMGKPVIAGLNDKTISSILKFFKIPNVLPWQRPRTQLGLNDCLMELVVNHDYRNQLGKMGRQFMEEIWSDKNIGRKLGKFYESL